MSSNFESFTGWLARILATPFFHALFPDEVVLDHNQVFAWTNLLKARSKDSISKVCLAHAWDADREKNDNLVSARS